MVLLFLPLLAPLSAVAAAAAAAPPYRDASTAAGHTTLTVSLPPNPRPVNPLVMGCHTDSGFAAEPFGFESQMVVGESFEVRGGAHVVDPSAPPTNISWNHVFDGAATFSFDAATPFHGNASQRIAMASGTHAAVTNRGLNNEGLLLHAAKDYTGYVFAKAARPTKLRVALRDHVRNATLASVELSISAGDWRMYKQLLPDAER